MKTSIKVAGIVTMGLAFAGLVFATITFDASTGVGFVGKGDVQVPLGWNNAQLQNNADKVVFTYQTIATYDVVEIFATGNPDQPKSLTSHELTQTTVSSIAGALNGSPRKEKGQNQFTGFNLLGYNGEPVIVGGALPTVDVVNYVTYTWTDNKGVVQTTDDMPVDADGNLYTQGGNKAVLSVTLLSSTGGLYANGVLIAP